MPADRMKLRTNPAASLRDDQEDAIRHVVEGRGRLLVVPKTGWGKSAVHFIATKLLREQGAGASILIHYQMPGSVVAYYQQVGRAGRNEDPSIAGGC